MVGVLVGLGLMAVFTVFWASWAVVSGSVVLAVVGVLLLAAGVLLLLRRVQLRDVREPGPSGGSSRVLPIALLVEVVAIVAAVAVLRGVDPELIQPTIAAIVGLHFLIFQADARTRHPMHLVTAGVGLLVGLAGVAAILGGLPPGVVHGLVGVGMSAVTISYGTRFVRGLRAARGPQPT